MASAELLQLYKLHKIDVGLLELKNKSTALDAGKKFQSELEKVKQDFDKKNAEYHRVHGEQKDLELTNKQIEDKIKSIETQLFSGRVTNPKEVEAFETQKKSLAKQRDDNDEKILEYWDQVPPLQKTAEDAQKLLAAKTAQLEEWKTKATVFIKQLEESFKELSTKRPVLAKTVEPNLLTRYEAIRQKRGIGLSEVTREKTCEECGSFVAEMQLIAMKEDRTVQCEGCQRILYWTGGI